jgi:hypothetical protein
LGIAIILKEKTRQITRQVKGTHEGRQYVPKKKRLLSKICGYIPSVMTNIAVCDSDIVCVSQKIGELAVGKLPYQNFT